MKKLAKNEMKKIAGGIAGSLESCYSSCDAKLAKCRNSGGSARNCSQAHSECYAECNITWG